MNRFPPATLALALLFVACHIGFTMAPAGVKEWLFFTFSVLPIRFGADSPIPFDPAYMALLPLIGHAFLHGGWLHLGMNTLVFLQGGDTVERRLGAGRFVSLFLISAIGGATAYILINSGSDMPAVGASGAVCGVFAAYFFAVRRDWKAALRDPQIQRAVFVFLLVNVGLAAAARMTGFIPIAWEAHLGGFLAGAAAYPFLARPARAGPWG